MVITVEPLLTDISHERRGVAMSASEPLTRRKGPLNLRDRVKMTLRTQEK